MEMVSPMPGQCHGDIITMCVTWSTHTTLGRFTFGHIHSSRYIALLGWSTTTGHIPRTVSSRPGAPHPPTTILVEDPIKLLLLAGPILDLIHTPEPERPAYGPPESWRKTRPAVFLFQSFFSRLLFCWTARWILANRNGYLTCWHWTGSWSRQVNCNTTAFSWVPSHTDISDKLLLQISFHTECFWCNHFR